MEEGECVFIAKNRIGQSRYDRITAMIEQSELNSESANRAMALADKLVPYSLLGTAVTYALTRNVARAISILMVDFSCALKLAMPLSFLSAISEAGRHHITVKGGNYLELMHNADTIVFDKTAQIVKPSATVLLKKSTGEIKSRHFLGRLLIKSRTASRRSLERVLKSKPRGKKNLKTSLTFSFEPLCQGE